MRHQRSKHKRERLKLPVFAACAAALLGLPTAGFALVGLEHDLDAVGARPLDFFTPASVDPSLAARVAVKAREKGLRFTPASTNPLLRDQTVTVAVRIDTDAANAISVRDTIAGVPGAVSGIDTLKPARFDLGTARGYKSFARTVTMPDNIRDLSMPDLADFAPATGSAKEKPGRLQPRIELEDKQNAGRSPGTLEALGAQTVDLGGSFRISSKVDVTAGVRLSQERDRLDPLTNSVQDSQAVYLGTQIKF